MTKYFFCCVCTFIHCVTSFFPTPNLHYHTTALTDIRSLHCTIVLQYIQNKHQHNTDDGRQAIGEELRYIHVQMSR